MKETIDTIMKWHKETFPYATLSGQIIKYAEQTNEFMNAERDVDLFELADMVIVCAGIIRFNKRLGSCFLQNTYAICWEIGEYDMTELWEAVEKKMEKNRKRVWNKTKWWLKEIVENHRYTPIQTAEKELKGKNNE